MTTKATQRIKKLRIGEISLVPEGDNPAADVLILKHRDRVGTDLNIAKQTLGEVRERAVAIAKALSEGGTPMDIETLTEKLNGIEKSLEAVQTENTTLKSQVETITKERDDALAAVEVEKAKAAAKIPPKAQADGGADDPDGDDEVMKSLPQALRDRIEKDRKQVEELTASIEKERDERAEGEMIEKVKATGLTDPEKFGKLVHRVAKGKSEAADADTILELLTKASAVAKGGEKLFTRIGKAAGNDTEAGDAQAKLDHAAVEIQKGKPALTREQAFAEACEANPSLYDEIRSAK